MVPLLILFYSFVEYSIVQLEPLDIFILFASFVLYFFQWNCGRVIGAVIPLLLFLLYFLFLRNGFYASSFCAGIIADMVKFYLK